MKFKIFLCSLVLLSCLTSVSVNSSTDGIICDPECGPYINARCTDVYEIESRSHSVTVQGYNKTCVYEYVKSYTSEDCIFCGTRWITGLHAHGERGHDSYYCGMSNTLICSLDGTVYN